MHSTKKINFATIQLVRLRHGDGKSSAKIAEELIALGHNIKPSTVRSYVRIYEDERKGVIRPEKKLPPQNTPFVRTKPFLKNLKRLISPPSSPYQTELANKLGYSRRIVERVLRENLQVKLRKKKKPYDVSEKKSEIRLIRSEILLNYLMPGKLKYVFTFDKTYIHLDQTIQKRDFYYEEVQLFVPDDLKLPCASWSKKLMVAIGICWFGKSKAYIIPSTAKVTAQVLIKSVLTPIVRKDLPRLYGEQSSKVWLHMDSAPSHTADVTQQWLVDSGQKFILKEHWPPYSPDISPLDYGVNGNLKRILTGRKCKDLDGLARVVKKVWDEYDIKKIRNALSA